MNGIPQLKIFRSLTYVGRDGGRRQIGGEQYCVAPDIDHLRGLIAAGIAGNPEPEGVEILIISRSETRPQN
jgi:hypothetical protein